jgi:CRISPR-associated endoribonuclease Cas6
VVACVPDHAGLGQDARLEGCACARLFATVPLGTRRMAGASAVPRPHALEPPPGARRVCDAGGEPLTSARVLLGRATKFFQQTPQGGLAGEIVYEGALEPFVPFLRLGELIHVGKGATFGMALSEAAAAEGDAPCCQ